MAVGESNVQNIFRSSSDMEFRNSWIEDSNNAVELTFYSEAYAEERWHAVSPGMASIHGF
jgi:hypothetical protein